MRIAKSAMARAAAAVASAAVLFIVSPAPAAHAAVESCSGWIHPNNGEGKATMEVTANLKVGPYASCSNVASVGKGVTVFLHCWADNIYGNEWWYVRVSGTSTYGWMSSDNLIMGFLDDNGDGVQVREMCGA